MWTAGASGCEVISLMTWCGVLGIGWVVTACAGAVLWERSAPTDTVIEAQSA